MRSASPNQPVADNGLDLSATRQSSMLADARTSVLDFLSNLIGSRRLDVACALYPKLDPDAAVEVLGRNLRGKEKRKVGTHEIDTILDVLGREAEESWFRFRMRRRGIHPPEVFQRDGEVDELKAEVAALREQVAEKDAALRMQAEAFARRVS